MKRLVDTSLNDQWILAFNDHEANENQVPNLEP